LAADRHEEREERQPGPGATAQGGPRAAGDQGGTGGSTKQETQRGKDRARRREGDEAEPAGGELPGRQAGSGAARSQ
jgi:hypothetical protein